MHAFMGKDERMVLHSTYLVNGHVHYGIFNKGTFLFVLLESLFFGLGKIDLKYELFEGLNRRIISLLLKFKLALSN